MTFFTLSRPGAPWDYATLGFIATANGAVLDGSLFTPVALTIPPDAYWSVGGSAEANITRYAQPVADALQPVPEIEDGWVLTYSDAANTYVPTSPEDWFAEDDTAAALTGLPSYAGARANPYDAHSRIYGSEAARAKVRRAMGFALAARSGTTLVNWHLAGDSLTAGFKAGSIGVDDFATILAAELRALGYPVTGGWVFPGNGSSQTDSRWAFTGTWQGKTLTTNNYVWTTVNGATTTFTATADVASSILEFAALPATTGTIGYNLDGGADVGTFSMTAGVMNIKQFTGLAAGSHNVVLTTSSTNTRWVCGARLRAPYGLSISTAGIFGSHTDDWLPTALGNIIINPYQLTAQINSTVVPKLVVIALGGNDAIHGTDQTPDTTPATMEANLVTIINAYQTAGAAVVMRTYPDFTATGDALIASKQAGGVTWETFLSGMYDVADTCDVMLVDHTAELGDPATLQAQGLMFTDELHLLSPGQAALARGLVRALIAA